MKLLFPLVITLFFGLVHYLTYKRIIQKLHFNHHIIRYATLFLLINFLAIVGYVSVRYYGSVPNIIYLVLSLAIGIGFMLFIALFLYEVLHLLQRNVPFAPEKRDLFKHVSDIGFVGLGLGYVGSAVYEGQKIPVINNIDIKQNLFQGHHYNIVQISDMHIGALIDKAFVQDAVARINALDADVVVITGDLVDAPVERVREAIDTLAYLKSTYGVYFIVGNHEYFHGIESIINYISELGIRVLENESLKIGHEDYPFWVTGVYDYFGYRHGSFKPDIIKATAAINDTAPTLLLAHQPRFLEKLYGFRPNLMLSGHTHGGQIWPFNHLVTLAQPYVKGLHQLHDDAYIYVNSGIGFWGPPMRLGSQAEITYITWS